MIGNDIVDLAIARKESNWKRPGYLDKLFTKSEQQNILNAENPELYVWSLWSRKEAVYKIINRETQIRAFIPLKIECLLEKDGFGICSYNEKKYFTKTEIISENIYSVAVTNIFHFDITTLLENRSSIQKSNGIPYQKETNYPVSISHHGSFERIIVLATNLLLS